MTNAKGGKQWPDELLLWLSEFNKF